MLPSMPVMHVPRRNVDARFGPQRMFGAARYGVAALTSSAVCGSTGGGCGSIVAVFVVTLAMSLVAASGWAAWDGKEEEGAVGRAQRYDHRR